jgi:hypothetical protein
VKRSPSERIKADPIRRHRLRLAIGIAFLCSNPALALQSSGELEIGGLYLSNERFGAHGTYGPAFSQGLHPLGGLDLTADSEPGRARILGTMSSRDFGELTAAALARNGDTIRLDYSRTARRGDDGLSLLQSSPELLTLPPGFTPGTTAQQLDLSQLVPVELGTRRERYGLSARVFGGPDWRTEVSFHNERRRGMTEAGAMVGVDPVSARSIILPADVSCARRTLDRSIPTPVRR